MTLTELFDLDESSGYSLAGSFTPDLVFSKLWLIRELARIQPRIGTMYILGSWYGNLSLLLDRYPRVQVDHVINVEPNDKFVTGSQRILHHAGVDNVEHMQANANSIDYRQLGRHGAVVNTSLTDMKGQDWFTNIPTGTIVALQARDHDPGRQFAGPKDIQRSFPVSQVLYSGALELKDPQTQYQRFMIIEIGRAHV